MTNENLIKALISCATGGSNCSGGEFPTYCKEVSKERNAKNQDCLDKLMLDAAEALKEKEGYKNWTYILFYSSDPDVESVKSVTRDLSYALKCCISHPCTSLIIWFDKENSSEAFTAYNAYNLMNDLINCPSLEREFIVECRKTLDPYIEEYFEKQKQMDEARKDKKEKEERKLLAELKAKYEKE